jgi:hypothetical protein
LLNTLGRAANASGNLRTFEYQSISGYPFGWVVHPGLRGGFSVIDTDILLVLDLIGLLQVRHGDDGTGVTLMLTDAGLAHYAHSVGPLSLRAG